MLSPLIHSFIQRSSVLAVVLAHCFCAEETHSLEKEVRPYRGRTRAHVDIISNKYKRHTRPQVFDALMTAWDLCLNIENSFCCSPRP